MCSPMFPNTSLILSLMVLVLASMIDGKRFHSLLGRQKDRGIMDSVPEGCRTTCGPFNFVLSECTSVQCMCTEGNNVALKICMDCLVDYGVGTPSSAQLRQQGELTITNFASNCGTQGVQVMRLSLNPQSAPGQPGGLGVVTAIPSITTRSVNTPSMAPSNGDGNGARNGMISPLPISSFISFALIAAGAVIVFL